jgi:DNA repair protein RecN (Recombination protein N)
MLSGLADSDTGQAHARELLAVAAEDRMATDGASSTPTRGGRHPKG